MSRIRVLREEVVNQIAAGEVVERPASVVKELVENALDAGARRISISVEQGGRRRIRVADDGAGMEREEAGLALQRHATSKLTEPSELAGIATLGFRGEALPAIASVSRMILTTSTGGDSGTRLTVEAGRITNVADAGHPRGTTVDVQDLFHNTPARARFLRAPATELAQIHDFIAAFAASVPGVRIALEHEGRSLLDVPPVSALEERIVDLCGEAWRRARPLAFERDGLRVRGLLAPSDETSAGRRLQHLFVNGRLVKDRMMAHAIGAATEGFLPRGRHASLFLFLECPSGTVDVNVHPAKAEVRFHEPRRVHDLVFAALRAALESALPIDSMSASAGPTPGPSGALEESSPGHAIHEATARYLAWEEARSRPAGLRGEGTFQPQASPRPSLESLAQRPPEALAQYAGTYIVASDAEGLLLVDQHAAHERIVFEQLLRQEESGAAGAIQELLFPITVPLERPALVPPDEAVGMLRELGFDAEPIGPAALVIRATPAVVEAGAVPRLVAELLEQIAGGATRADLPPLRHEGLLATVACHASVRAGMPLTGEKMNYLIRELFRTRIPLKCPHGRPSILRFTHASIEREFLRR